MKNCSDVCDAVFAQMCEGCEHVNLCHEEDWHDDGAMEHCLITCYAIVPILWVKDVEALFQTAQDALTELEKLGDEPTSMGLKRALGVTKTAWWKRGGET